MRHESANEQQRPRQFSLAKLLGCVTAAALLVASWRITGLVVGFTYATWAAGILTAMWMWMLLGVPDKLTSGLWLTVESGLAAPVGGGLAAMMGNALAGQLVSQTADPAQAELVVPLGFGFLGATCGLIVGILATILTAAHQFVQHNRRKRRLKARPEAKPPNPGKQVLVFALALICVAWLLIVAVSSMD